MTYLVCYDKSGNWIEEKFTDAFQALERASTLRGLGYKVLVWEVSAKQMRIVA